MLFHVHVENLALIEQCDIYFHEGLNILSGETGAGKSIIIGSIQFALGARASKEMIRTGAPYGLVELVFQVEDEATLTKLQELDIEIEDGQVIISRKMIQNRSVSKVNGETVSVSVLREIASLLIDIHGQHEHQSLFSTEKHLEILDAFAAEKAKQLKEDIAQEYAGYKQLQKKMESLEMDESVRAREIAFHEFEIGEIEDANLKEGEDVSLEEAYTAMSHGQKIVSVLGEVYDVLTNGRENASAMISDSVGALGKVAHLDENLSQLHQQVMDLEALCTDISREVEHNMSNYEFSEEQLQQTEERLNQMNHLKEKYGKSITDILAYCENAKKELEQLQSVEEEKAKCATMLSKTEKQLQELSAKLTKIRGQEAKKLEKAIVESLKGLNFLDVDFEIAFAKTEGYTANGQDKVEFMISTNPGEQKRPLAKIASGGELSRIMLGIKTILADKDHMESIIFDEIDSGISGKTAHMVAVKMNEIAKNHQVICITHLPQIACMSDWHYFIEKRVEQDKTMTDIRLMTEEESIQELARMLGGTQITAAAVENAKEMKKQKVEFS